MGTIDTSIIDDKEAFTTVMIPHRENLQHAELEVILDMLDTVAQSQGIASRSRSTGYHGSSVSYVDAYIEGLWKETGYGGVIPCRSLWDKEGNQLAAVLLFHSRLADLASPCGRHFAVRQHSFDHDYHDTDHIQSLVTSSPVRMQPTR